MNTKNLSIFYTGIYFLSCIFFTIFIGNLICNNYGQDLGFLFGLLGLSFSFITTIMIFNNDENIF